MQNNSKVLYDIINNKNLILTRLDLDTIRKKKDQAPKQQRKKPTQKAM